MAKILYGAPVKEGIKNKLKERIQKLQEKPVLAIVQVGDRPDSNIYIRKKIEFGAEIGVRVILKKFDEKITESDLVGEIQELNNDKEVTGIIVQLPLPPSLDTEKVIKNIDPKKDADGLVGSDKEGEMVITPATARAVMSLLDFYDIEVGGKKVVVIGRSRLAGGPIAKALEERGAEVTVCHKETPNIPEICREADILVSAAGQAGLVTGEFVNENQTLIDVGINKMPVEETFSRKSPRVVLADSTRHFAREVSSTGKTFIVGDVAFDEVEPLVKAITPVPGGIGPLTVACLFMNLFDLCYNNNE